jgi:hypothetical protein
MRPFHAPRFDPASCSGFFRDFRGPTSPGGGRSSSMATGESGRASIVLAALVFGVCSLSACAHRMGEQAAKGMMSGIQAQKTADPDHQVSRVAAGRAVEGALAALDGPEQREQIARVLSEAMSEAVHAAVQDATRQLVTELGPDGEGPLAVSLANTGARISAGVVGGARGELLALFPACAGPDARACIELELQQIARSTAAGFTKGVRDNLGWPLLIAAFAFGLTGGVLVTWLWSHRPQRRVLRHA